MNMSVIIPTYNRSEILLKCLQALEAQTVLPNDYEIVIVDDGSTDASPEQIAAFIDKCGLNVSYFHQDHKGPAAARNLGIREAQGNLVLFIGDDIIATPTLLAEHLTWHEKYPEENVAVLGYVTWSPDIKVTPFMRWLENGGPQFKFWAIDDPYHVSWRHLITANISFKRKFLLEHGFFDEDFPYAAYEDTELGYRLNKKGLSIVFNKEAIGYHYHPTTIDDAIKRMRNVGVSNKIFLDKTYKTGRSEKPPKRNWLWRNLSFVKLYFAKQLGYMAESRWTMPLLYSYVLDKAQYEINLTNEPCTK